MKTNVKLSTRSVSLCVLSGDILVRTAPFDAPFEAPVVITRMGVKMLSFAISV